MMYKIVETDNFGRDYLDEKFVNLPPTDLETANKLCAYINMIFSCGSSTRFWKVESQDYELSPGFEP